jgi:hypothetical protein
MARLAKTSENLGEVERSLREIVDYRLPAPRIGSSTAFALFEAAATDTCTPCRINILYAAA